MHYFLTVDGGVIISVGVAVLISLEKIIYAFLAVTFMPISTL